MRYMVECETCQTIHFESAVHMLLSRVWLCSECDNDMCAVCADMAEYHDHYKDEDLTIDDEKL